VSYRKNHWVQLGTIGKPHGLRGGFFVSGRSSLLPKGVKTLVLNPDKQNLQLVMKSQRLQSSRVVVFCDELNSPEDVKIYSGQTLWCARSEIKLNEREYLWADLIGCKVVDAKGILMGSIVRVENYGASDIVTIKADKSEQHVSIPFVSSYFQMDFGPLDDEISLLVGCDLFHDLWEGE
jgi:16S rRNA processing protein RimM